MTRLVRIAALLSVWCAGVFASPPRSTMAFAHKSGLVIRAAALPRLHGAFRSQTRKLSNLQIAKGSISTLYQAKGRTEESLKAFAPRLAAKKFELDVALLLKLEAERKEAQTLASELQAERDLASRKARALELKKKGEKEMDDGNYEQAVKTLLAAERLLVLSLCLVMLLIRPGTGFMLRNFSQARVSLAVLSLKRVVE